MCLLCCGSMSSVVCELCGVQLRPAVDVLVVPNGVRLASLIACDSHTTHDMLPQHQINITK